MMVRGSSLTLDARLDVEGAAAVDAPAAHEVEAMYIDQRTGSAIEVCVPDAFWGGAFPRAARSLKAFQGGCEPHRPSRTEDGRKLYRPLAPHSVFPRARGSEVTNDAGSAIILGRKC